LVNNTKFKRGENVISILSSNVGNQRVDSITFSYQLNQDSIVNEKVTALHLLPDSFITYTFNKPFTLKNSGVNILTVWVTTPNDTNRIDDTLTHFINIPKVIQCSLDSIKLIAPLHVGTNAIKLHLHNTGEADIIGIKARLTLDSAVVANEIFTTNTFLNGSSWEGQFPHNVTITSQNEFTICVVLDQAYSTEDSIYINNNIKCLTYTAIQNGLQELNASNISLFPNPASDKWLNIRIGQELVNAISIFNLQGQQVLNQEIESRGNIQLDISSIQPGYYFVSIQTNKGTMVKPLIKQ